MTCLHCLLFNHCSVVVWSSDHLILILTLCLMLSQLKTNYNDVCCTYIYICVCEWLHLVTSTRVDLFLHKVFIVNVHFFWLLFLLEGEGGGGGVGGVNMKRWMLIIHYNHAKIIVKANHVETSWRQERIAKEWERARENALERERGRKFIMHAWYVHKVIVLWRWKTALSLQHRKAAKDWGWRLLTRKAHYSNRWCRSEHKPCSHF